MIKSTPDDPANRSHTVIIQPARGLDALNLREIWAFRDLLMILMLRDVKLRYKQTALGVLWVILQPLVAAGIFTVIFGLFARLPSDEVNYLPFVFSGLLGWNIFANALQRAGNSLLTDARLISKVYFPRILLPISSSLAVLVDFVVALGVLLVLLFATRIPLTPNIFVLPLYVALVLLLALGVSLFVSALNVYYRDFSYALPFLIQVWMYASPVVYSPELIPEAFQSLYALNPMVGVIEGFRWTLLGVGEFPLVSTVIALVIGGLMFVGGALVFYRVENNFADVI